MTRPLDGLRVVDCSNGTAGIRASGMLGDYGADVIWVEPPGGSACRTLEPAATSTFCRNKRGLVLDLKTAEDRAALLELLDGADLFIESWRPGVAERLGVGWSTAHARNPHLVYCSISGFGRSGPFRDLRGYESTVHALVGTMGEQIGHRGAPVYQGLPFASIGAAYLAVIGALAAIYRRDHDGVGRWVETSMLDGALSYLSVHWGESDASVAAAARGHGDAQGVVGTTDGQRFITRSFLCADEQYLGIHTGAVGAFDRLMKLLGLDDRIPPGDSSIDMGVMLDPDQAKLVAEEIPKIFATEPRSVWIDRLIAADVCGIEHLEPGQIFDQEQAVHNGMIVEVDDPVLGIVQQAGPPLRFSYLSEDGGAVTAAPTPGQDRVQVLAAPPSGAWRDAAIGRPSGDPSSIPLLDGINILDFGAYYAGPYSSRLLADLGAEVVKVEPPLGDQLRGLERCFYSAQAGKRSLAANLKDPGLRPAVAQLLAWADIVHHNLRPGAAERLGVGYEDARKARNDVIYVHAPGWGSTGPFRQRQSFAPMLSGLAGITFEVSGEFNPPLPPVATEDPGNGLLGAVAMLIALIHRRRTGVGGYVENPQINATMAHMAHVVRRASGSVVGTMGMDPLQTGRHALDRLYEAADGWVAIACLRTDEIEGLERALGISILEDERYGTNQLRSENDYALSGMVAAAIERRPIADLLSALAREGATAVQPVGHNTHAFLNDVAQRRAGRVAECDHPTKGRIRELAQLVRVTDAAVVPHQLAPELGEHTDELLDTLGYERSEIDLLRSRGAIA